MYHLPISGFEIALSPEHRLWYVAGGVDLWSARRGPVRGGQKWRFHRVICRFLFPSFGLLRFRMLGAARLHFL